MLELHHIFPAANRKKSEKYGLVVWLNHFYHNEPPDGVHFNRANDLFVKRAGQIAFEEKYTREDFMRLFGKNYL